MATPQENIFRIAHTHQKGLKLSLLVLDRPATTGPAAAVVAPPLSEPVLLAHASTGAGRRNTRHHKMIPGKSIDEIFAAVARVLPSTPADVQRNARAALTAALDRLDLVTREELEVQEAVLARTRARLKELEEKVAALERLAVKP